MFPAKNAHSALCCRVAFNAPYPQTHPIQQAQTCTPPPPHSHPYIVFRCKNYLGAMGLTACMGSKSCCDTCCVGAAWVGLGVLADLGKGSVGNGLLRFVCVVFTFTPSMSRASSAIIVAIKRSTSKRTAACSLFVMSRIVFKARCTSAKALTAPPPYVQNHHPKTVSSSLPKTAAQFFYV